MARKILLTAAVLGFLGVALGAFGAHGLDQTLPPKQLANYDTAVRYHMYHALALLGLVAVANPLGVRTVRIVAWSFTLGVILFSGSLYLYAVTGKSWLGAITPIGGLGFLVGWAVLAIGAIRHRPPSSGSTS